jgi:hypothetical protein
VEAGVLKPGKELAGARNAAKGDNRAFDDGDLHAAMKAPDRTPPKAEATERLLHIRRTGTRRTWNRRFRHGERNHRGAADCMQRFAQISRRKQAILEIGARHKQNVDVAMELTVLESVIEEMDGAGRG